MKSPRRSLISLTFIIGLSFGQGCASTSDSASTSPYSKEELAAALAEPEIPIPSGKAEPESAAAGAGADDPAAAMFAGSSLVPKARDRVPEKGTIVLLADKTTKILCEGKLSYAFVGNDNAVEQTDLNGQCAITLKPKVQHGFTNLMVKDSRTVYHRNIEIRGPSSKDYKNATKYYKAEVKLTAE